MRMRTYLQNFLNEYPYEEADKEVYLSAYDKIMQNAEANAKFFALIDGHERGERVGTEHRSIVEEVAKCVGVPPCTAEMLTVFCLSREAEKRMLARGVEKEIIHDTFYDFFLKNWETKYMCGVAGTVFWDWHCRFLDGKIYALGRLQFEITEFNADRYEKDGRTVRRGDRVLSIHIPRVNAPFDPLSCSASIERARRFFAKKFGFCDLPFVCSSWLLYPLNKQILPPTSNIVQFTDRFDILYVIDYPDDKTPVYAFLFGVGGGVALSDLPRYSSLQRAYVEHLQKGGHTGYGYGVFF